jgi:rhamnosyltransferase
MPDVAPTISLIIPVKDGGEDLGRCLDAIGRQRTKGEVEVIVIDSSSSDGSAELARERGARVEVIPAADFDHGGTRNLGARLARGEFLVFTSQDAYAEGDDWLALLMAPLREREDVAGVYGRQLAHHDATPPERYFLDFLYGGRARVQEARVVEELSVETTLFSNVNAAIRRSVWEREPFVEDIIMSEDQEWSRRALLGGWRLVYEPRAAVRHSHPYTLAGAFRRFFDSGVSAERAYLAGARPSARVLRRAAARYARGEVAWLWRTGQRRWLPYAAVYELAKFAGLQLGTRHRWLPRSIKLRASALPSYWERAAAGSDGR